MASFVPLKCSVTLRLNTGADPETGKAILKTVSMRGIDPAVVADKLNTAMALVKPLFAHPVIIVEKSQVDELDAA